MPEVGPMSVFVKGGREIGPEGGRFGSGTTEVSGG